MRFPWLFGRARKPDYGTIARSEAPPEKARLIDWTAAVEEDGGILANPAQVGACSIMCTLPPEQLAGFNCRFISWLTPEDQRLFEHLPGEAYVGAFFFRQPRMPDLFIRNSIFIEFMHFTAASVGPELEILRETARRAWRTGGRNLYIFDGRMDQWLAANPDGMPENEEIVGLFQVDAGTVSPARWRRDALRAAGSHRDHEPVRSCRV